MSRRSWWRSWPRRGCNSFGIDRLTVFGFIIRVVNFHEKIFFYIAQCGICALLLFHSALATPSIAETMRIIGDRTPAVQSNTGAPTGGEPSSSSGKGSSIIRIVGDRQFAVRKPSAKQPPEQPAAVETAEQRLAQRLESLKAEEQRKAAEKTGHDQSARLKAEQENKAALQAAIEQEQRKSGNAEEPRTAPERCIEPLTAAEKCLDAAESATVEKPRQEVDVPHGQTDLAAPSVDAPKTASPAAKPFVSGKTAPLPEQILAGEPAKPKSKAIPDLPLEYWLMQMRSQWRLR